MKKFFVIVFSVCIIVPSIAFGATKFSYGVWIPYWKRTTAIPEVVSNISKIKTISPFSYEVQKNGKIWDAMKLKEESWLQLFELTGSEGKTIIPTVSWANGDEIHTYLSSTTLRVAHIKNIITLVDQNDFDGVDINYENKRADTRVYFTKFGHQNRLWRVQNSIDRWALMARCKSRGFFSKITGFCQQLTA